MLLKSIQFKNFKRFSDLTIDLDPTNSGEIPKLVLLIGTNGSGKSSVFDGFENLNTLFKKNLRDDVNASEYLLESSLNYFHKNGAEEYSIDCNFTGIHNGHFYTFSHFKSNNKLEIQTSLAKLEPNSFYGRTAFRYIPTIEIYSINAGIKLESDDDRAKNFISEDKQRFENDASKAIGDIVSNLFSNPKKSGEYSQDIKNKLNQAFLRIFGKSDSTSLFFDNLDIPSDGNPLRFWFKKGGSRIDYNLLSAGEKMVFLILFNLYVRNKYFQNTIYFLDELDSHLNTVLQKNLLKEVIENWIPDGCQLWTASHSLGFIEYAREYDKGAIIDFDNLDFDKKHVLEPKQANEFDVYDVIFDLENKVLKAKFIHFLQTEIRTFVCEGANQQIFAKFNLPKLYFTNKYGKNKTNKTAVISITENEGIFGLIDRDYLTLAEIEKLKTENPRLHILDYYCFENYLYHPQNILELKPETELEEYKQSLLDLKNQVLDSLVANISLARNSYKILENQEVEIKKILESDNFEEYYPLLNINKINKSELIQKYQLPNENQLSKTDWLKTQIESILS